jgi:hypothetical protein
MDNGKIYIYIVNSILSSGVQENIFLKKELTPTILMVENGKFYD